MTQRLPTLLPALDLVKLSRLHFEEVDPTRFPLLGLAQSAYRQLGPFGTCLFSLANEEGVARFSGGTLSFGGITTFVRKVLDDIPCRPLESVASISELHEQVRQLPSN